MAEAGGVMNDEQYMIKLYGIRRANLRRMCDEAGGQTILAKKIGFTQGRLSQLMYLPFSEKVARRIEYACGIKLGSLDK